MEFSTCVSFKFQTYLLINFLFKEQNRTHFSAMHATVSINYATFSFWKLTIKVRKLKKRDEYRKTIRLNIMQDVPNAMSGSDMPLTL